MEATSVPFIASAERQAGFPSPSTATGGIGASVWPGMLYGEPQPLHASVGQLRQAALTFNWLPAIFKRRSADAPDIEEELNVSVPDWGMVKRVQHAGPAPRRSARTDLDRSGSVGKPKMSKAKGHTSGRTYTSKYRGVHQTFPTKRWEAQFRRNGKPTSLGCFDHEEQAARAYDKMMLWCELHNTSGVKGGITNFDPTEYEKDLHQLSSVTQDELVQALRSDGRRQAAQRMLRMKRDGQMMLTAPEGGFESE
ncbi:hypothetical protein WJX81_008669 [Elliptochloris bilobata]|uniref:AP2/ERF domain-containing protein n=1 Tax=Elliptochloris bilobata TaxID=381761 RepID=A0AAW1SM42_9CHLO